MGGPVDRTCLRRKTRKKLSNEASTTTTAKKTEKKKIVVSITGTHEQSYCEQVCISSSIACFQITEFRLASVVAWRRGNLPELGDSAEVSYGGTVGHCWLSLLPVCCWHVPKVCLSTIHYLLLAPLQALWLTRAHILCIGHRIDAV